MVSDGLKSSKTKRKWNSLSTQAQHGQKQTGLWTLDKDCPIKELKPKELEWFDNGDFSVTRNDSYTIEKIRICDGVSPVYRAFWHGLLIADRDLLSDTKQLCQKHYNKLFAEIIGGE